MATVKDEAESRPIKCVITGDGASGNVSFVWNINHDILHIDNIGTYNLITYRIPCRWKVHDYGRIGYKVIC